jgi:cytochrome c oxidase assembly protein subunit 15
MTSLLRGLTFVALLLVAVTTVTSAWIRLVHAGAGCADWPACHAAAEGGPGEGAGASRGSATGVAPPATGGASPGIASGAVQAAPSSRDHPRIRLTHRLAASAVGVLILVVAGSAWLEADRRWRRAALLAIALTAALAALGRFTPSPIPVVAAANLLGGLALAATLGWMLGLRGGGPGREGARSAEWHAARRDRRLVLLAFAAIALQAFLGTLLSTRHALAACPDLVGCLPARLDATLANPFAATALPLDPALLAAPARQSLQFFHRLGALLSAALIVAAALACRRAHPRLAGLLAVLVGIQIVLGAATVTLAVPPEVAVSHNAVAVAIAAALAALLAAATSRPRSAAG